MHVPTPSTLTLTEKFFENIIPPSYKEGVHFCNSLAKAQEILLKRASLFIVRVFFVLVCHFLEGTRRTNIQNGGGQGGRREYTGMEREEGEEKKRGGARWSLKVS